MTSPAVIASWYPTVTRRAYREGDYPSSHRQLWSRVDWFRARIGGIAGENVLRAFQLARAELLMLKLDGDVLRFRWEWDDDPDLSWMDERELKEDHEVLGLILESLPESTKHDCPSCQCDKEWNVIDSLWGIVDPSDDDRRLYEAEMLTNNMDNIKALLTRLHPEALL